MRWAAGLGLSASSLIDIRCREITIRARCRMSLNLTDLANKYNSDKGTISGGPPHKYTYLYDMILNKYTSQPINFLELGLAQGGPEVGGPVDRTVASPSVQMWLEYFPRAHIFGFDISDFSHINHSRFTFVRGDGGVEEDLRRLAESAPAFNVVIDDGSHASLHQQLALKALFPKLADDAIYIIEDLHWQSPTYEDGAIMIPKTAEFLIEYFVRGHYVENSILSLDTMEAIKSRVQAYAWFPSFDGNSAVPKLFVFRT